MGTQVSAAVITSQTGHDALGGSHMRLIVQGRDVVFFSPGSDHNHVDLPKGGAVLLNGTNNTVNGRGYIAVAELGPQSNHNTFVIGPGVTSFSGANIQPSDVFRLYGFTKEDVASAFASKRQASPHLELLTLSHPGGATVRVALGFAHPGDAPTIAQFHPVPG